jgi:hypothetical protein
MLTHAASCFFTTLRAIFLPSESVRTITNTILGSTLVFMRGLLVSLPSSWNISAV